jgi:hypothetical protein
MRHWRFVGWRVHAALPTRGVSSPVHVTVRSTEERSKLVEAMMIAGVPSVDSGLAPPTGVEFVTVAGSDVEVVLRLRDAVSVDWDGS